MGKVSQQQSVRIYSQYLKPTGDCIYLENARDVHKSEIWKIQQIVEAKD